MNWRFVLNPFFWWRDIQRRIDLAILWPACKREAPDLDHAKAAFAYHAYRDRAWRDFTEDELFDFIEGLQ